MNFRNSSARFAQQILFLLQAHRTGRARCAETIRAITDLRGQAYVAGGKIDKLKDTFRRWSGKDYDGARNATDERTVKALQTFGQEYGTAFREAEGERARILAAVDVLSADMGQVEAWLTPTGLLVNSFLNFFNVEQPDALVPGRIFVSANAFPNVQVGDPRRKKLDGIQDQITILLTQWDVLQNASVPADLFKQRMAAMLNGSGLSFAAKSIFNHRSYAFDTSSPLTLKDLAVIMGADALVDRLFEVSKDHQKIYPPVDVQTRKDNLKDLDERIRALAQAEEREVLTLFDAGVFVTRRETADPAVLVDVWNSEGA